MQFVRVWKSSWDFFCLKNCVKAKIKKAPKELPFRSEQEKNKIHSYYIKKIWVWKEFFWKWYNKYFLKCIKKVIEQAGILILIIGGGFFGKFNLFPRYRGNKKVVWTNRRRIQIVYWKSYWKSVGRIKFKDSWRIGEEKNGIQN